MGFRTAQTVRFTIFPLLEASADGSRRAESNRCANRQKNKAVEESRAQYRLTLLYYRPCACRNRSEQRGKRGGLGEVG